MPRTKAPRRKEAADATQCDQLLNGLRSARVSINNEIDEQCIEVIRKYKKFYEQLLFEIPVNMLNKPISEIESNSSTTKIFSSYIDATVSDLLKSIKTKPINKSNQMKRFPSSVEGEGAAGGRQSRQKRRTNSKSVSKSLPRSNMLNTNAMISNLKTPINRNPPPTYGTVTPKVKPNMPQVLLRRPRQGEVALSLQGSPLFTSSVVGETVANVNIPMGDGQLLSIQPKRGLRLSQIPALDLETKQQLGLLRDNLNKFCAIK